MKTDNTHVTKRYKCGFKVRIIAMWGELFVTLQASNIQDDNHLPI